MINLFETFIKKGLKSTLLLFSQSSYLFSINKRKKIHVFLYHDVTNNPSNFAETYGLNVTPVIFKKQLEFIKKNYHVIDPKKIFSIKKTSKSLALITFDDGLKGYFENAIPILQEYDLPSIIFLNGGVIKQEPFWSGLAVYLCNHDDKFRSYQKNNKFLKQYGSSSYLYLKKSQVEEYFEKNSSLQKELYSRVYDFHSGFATESDLKKVDGNPLVSFGNHLYNHYNAANLSSRELKINYIKNYNFLNHYQSFIPDVFSYPFGQPESCFNESTNKDLIKFGAKIIFSAMPGGNKKINRSVIRRIAMSNNLKNDSEIRKYVNYKIFSSLIRFKTKKKLFQLNK